jgi:hypothetical protein
VVLPLGCWAGWDSCQCTPQTVAQLLFCSLAGSLCR